MSELICYCFQVSKDELVRLIVEEGLESIEELSERTNACRGCRGCWLDLEDLIIRYSKQSDKK